MKTEDKVYIVNPNYIMKNDENRVFVTYRYHLITSSPMNYDADMDFLSFIHPIQAKVFSLFDGVRTFSEILKEVARIFKIEENRAESLLIPFLENGKALGVNFQENKFIFPKNFIVPYRKDVPAYIYNKEEFECENLDFEKQRLSYPLDIVLMLNTICNVDCIYCYADCRKKMDCQIPVDKLDKLIDDCRINNVRSLDLMGGEVLKYKNWRWLVSKMIKSGYMPYISTKIPVEMDVVKDLYDLGIRTFQISLDSFEPDIIEKNLNITRGEGYLNKMKRTLGYFEEIGIKLHIHAVITTYNKEISHLERYLKELLNYKNIVNVQLSVVGNSLYKEGYNNHKLKREEATKLSEFVKKSIQENRYPYKLNISVGLTGEDFISPMKIKENNFNQRGLCTANIRQAYILPTGEITICEQLMFNPTFILGNLLNDDLGTIWRNNKLKKLENQALYKNSRCGKCNNFIKCRDSKSNGVCWKEILYAYGEEKWTNPDPKCSYAPTKMNSFFIK